jgi:Transposase and inactivated derivatives, IS30 family
MRRTFTAKEKASVFELWKKGTGFSEIANILGSKPGTIFTMLRDTGGIKPNERKRAVAHLTLSEREEIRAGLSAKMSIRAIATALNRSPSTISLKFSVIETGAITQLLMLITGPTEWRKDQNRAYWIRIYRYESLSWKSWR